MDVNKLVEALTREEKVALVSGADQWHTVGVPHLGIPPIMVSDGPHGLRKQAEEGDRLGIGLSTPATCFPPAATTANSWDPGLLFAMGEAIGNEALHEGVSVVLGPGINIKRSPLCGRNFEYFSEDPYLTGELATAWIDGIQSVGVGACVKHFAANNQERWRMLNDSLVDERALRELYLAGFEKAVRRGQPWTVMPAYNKLNGTYCCENPELLNSILRAEWGFNGATISDWGAVNDPTLSVRAGLDLEMPASYGVSAQQIEEDLASGRLTEQELNRPVRRVLDLAFKGRAERREYQCDFDAHHILARKIATESAVLLKNDEAILPISPQASIAIVGQFAEHPRYQGTGSSLINPTRLDTILALLESEGAEYKYVKGYDLEHDEISEDLVAQACAVATEVDVAIIFAGLTARFESEGYDRTHLELPPSHNALIQRIVLVNPNVVVVLSAGAPVTMPWLPDVKGVLHTYLGGQGGAGAALDLLYGKANPSGKLAESYPFRLCDCLATDFFAYNRDTTEYRESIFVGYRYYDAAEKDVLFPFGYGLSYTEFGYENMEVSARELKGTDSVMVRCTLRNIGPLAGAEVVQLYIGKDSSPIFRAPQELKAFQKVYLKPGEERTVEFVLAPRTFAYYNTEAKDWHVEAGEYHIAVGSSSRDLSLVATVHIKASHPEVKAPDYRSVAPAYYHLGDQGIRISQDAFKAVYGKEFPKPGSDSERFHRNSTLEDLTATAIGRIALIFAKKYLWKMTKVTDEQDPLWIMSWSSTLEMPLRSMVAMSGGTIPAHLVQGLLAWANGKRLQALKLWFSR